MRSLVNQAYNRYQSGGIGYLGTKVRSYVQNVATDLLKSDYPPELVLTAYRNGFKPESYCWLGLHEHGDPDTYITTPAPIRRVNRGYRGVIDNKYSFARFTAAYSDALPTLYGTVEAGQFRPIQGFERTTPLSLVDTEGWIVLKPIDANHGEGFYILESEADEVVIKGRDGVSPSAASMISQLDNYLVMEYVDQHDYAEDIYPDATNTIRLFTVIDPDTLEPRAIRAAHRFGSAASAPTDNWSAGGYCAPIDIETGTLGPIVSLEDGLYRREHDTHPETGTQVRGSSIPYWQECVELVHELAELHRPARCVGWDIIVTDDGPIVIEANAGTGIHLLQATEGLLADPVARRLLT